jgi:hypothetical protein
VLAARRPSDGSGTHGIVRVDPTTGKVERVFDDPEMHDIQACALVPRLTPDRRSSAVKDPDEEGSEGHGATHAVAVADLYALDVYRNDLATDLPPGTVTHVRVLEGLPREAQDEALAPQLPGPPVPGTSRRGVVPLAIRRLVGVAPVERDGSLHLTVPADIPLQLQILDQDGLALRSSGWIWAQFRGRQGCVGCHEDAEVAPENRLVSAVARPSNKLVLAPRLRRTVDFQHDIAPIVKARCASCHGEGKDVRLDAGDGVSGVFPRGYETLLAGLQPGPDGRVEGRYVHPGRARTSPVIWHLLGRNTARPWDGDWRQKPFKAMPPESRLTSEERTLFIEWIDLGALYDAAIGAPEGAGAPETGGHP